MSKKISRACQRRVAGRYFGGWVSRRVMGLSIPLPDLMRGRGQRRKSLRVGWVGGAAGVALKRCDETHGVMPKGHVHRGPITPFCPSMGLMGPIKRTGSNDKELERS